VTTFLFSSKEVPSFDEPEPQPNSLPNFPSLDVNLGIEKGPDPPIKPHSLGSFTLKVVDFKPCREEANIGVEHNLTCLHHPFMIDHKKHYGFKPGLLGLKVRDDFFCIFFIFYESSKISVFRKVGGISCY
jgi:hypothetical protein